MAQHTHEVVDGRAEWRKAWSQVRDAERTGHGTWGSFTPVRLKALRVLRARQRNPVLTLTARAVAQQVEDRR